MILCKHGLTEIIMIYCIANQPKNAIFAEKWGGKVPKRGQDLPFGAENLLIGAKDLPFGAKPPNWHIYFSHYGYFKEIGH